MKGIFSFKRKLRKGHRSCPLIVRLTDFGDHFASLECDIALYSLFVENGVQPPPIVKADDVHSFSRINAAYSLLQATRRVPVGTIFIAVIDPGVGTEREPVLIETEEQHTFIGPNNGIFGPVIDLERVKAAYQLDAIYFIRLCQARANAKSNTFDGRDMFSPAAALTACGKNVLDFASTFDPKKLKRVQFERDQILHIDKFGNIKINAIIPEEAQALFLETGEKRLRIPVVKTFGCVQSGELLAYTGSSSALLEIAVREGNAAKRLKYEVEECLSIDWEFNSGHSRSWEMSRVLI
jgi:S-adenosylmethionine hydrolase